MKTRTVTEIAKELHISEETVRRWIRTGTLKADKESNRAGNIISEKAYREFLKKFPKYAAKAVAASSAAVALAPVLAPVLGTSVAVAAAAYAMLTRIKGISVSGKESAPELEKKLRTALEAKRCEIQNKRQQMIMLRRELDELKAEVNRMESLIEEINAQAAPSDDICEMPVQEASSGDAEEEERRAVRPSECRDGADTG